MIKDGLWDAFNGYHMGTTAENVAKQVADHPRAAGRVRGRRRRTRPRPRRRPASSRTRSSPVTIKARKGDIVVDTDEYPKAGVTLDSIAKLRPAFDKEGTVTAANASGINDGAAAVVLMKAERGRQGTARRRSRASCPGRMPASIRRSWAPGRSRPRARRCKKAGWKVERPRSDRGQRGVRRAGLRGQQGPRLGHRQGQRQRRRDRASAIRSARPARAC